GERPLELAAAVAEHALQCIERFAQPVERDAQLAGDRAGDMSQYRETFDLQQLGFRFEAGALGFELVTAHGDEFVMCVDLPGNQIWIPDKPQRPWGFREIASGYVIHRSGSAFASWPAAPTCRAQAIA